MHNKSHLLQLPVNVGFYSDLNVIKLNQPMKKITTVYCVWTVGAFLCLLLEKNLLKFSIFLSVGQ